MSIYGSQWLVLFDSIFVSVDGIDNDTVIELGSSLKFIVKRQIETNDLRGLFGALYMDFGIVVLPIVFNILARRFSYFGIFDIGFEIESFPEKAFISKRNPVALS